KLLIPATDGIAGEIGESRDGEEAIRSVDDPLRTTTTAGVAVSGQRRQAEICAVEDGNVRTIQVGEDGQGQRQTAVERDATKRKACELGHRNGATGAAREIRAVGQDERGGINLAGVIRLESQSAAGNGNRVQ